MDRSLVFFCLAQRWSAQLSATSTFTHFCGQPIWSVQLWQPPHSPISVISRLAGVRSIHVIYTWWAGRLFYMCWSSLVYKLEANDLIAQKH